MTNKEKDKRKGVLKLLCAQKIWNPKVLPSFRSLKVKQPEEGVIASLTGYYKSDQLYLLKTNYKSYNFFTHKLGQIDLQIEELLKE